MNKQEIIDYLHESSEKAFIENIDNFKIEEAVTTGWTPEMFREYCKAIFSAGYAEGYKRCSQDITDYTGPYGPPNWRQSYGIANV